MQSKTNEFLYGDGTVLHSDCRDGYTNRHVINFCTFYITHTGAYKAHINKNPCKNW